MDTAVMKSWCEVVRRTDPLIWSLAIDGAGLATPDVESSLSPLHHHHLHRQPQQQQQQVLSALASSSGPPSARESGSAASALGNSCRSLLDPHPQNAIEWLRCLIQTTQDDASKDQGHRQQRRKDQRGTLCSQADFELAREVFSRKTGSRARDLHCCSHGVGAEEAASLAVAAAVVTMSSSDGTTQSRHRHQGGTRRGTAASMMSTTYIVSSNKNHAEGGGGGGGRAAASFATSTSATSDTSTPMTSATGSSMTTTALAETETTPKKPLAAEQPTEAAAALSFDPSPALHMQSSTSTSAQRSSVSPPVVTSSAAAPTATPSSAVSSANNPTTDADADVTNTVTSTRIPTRFSKLWPSQTFFHTATNVIHNGLIRSKDATTAFLYRTFSPTYRISRLYIDSWSNGSQRRGLVRIKNGFTHGDAFTLVKCTTARMKDVWNQVMVAYRVKSSANARARKKDNKQSISDGSKAEKPTPVSNRSGDTRGSNGGDSKQDDGNGGGSKSPP